MPSEKSPETELDSIQESISENANDWIQQFIKHLELNLIDTCHSLPPEVSKTDYQNLAIQAMFQTLIDSGMNLESIVETIGQTLINPNTVQIEWNSEMNQRRFELIDKDIQETITADEEFELAGLTNMMREQFESEEYLPFKSAQSLHRKLLNLDVEDIQH